jgi:hypothetical protein
VHAYSPPLTDSGQYAERDEGLLHRYPSPFEERHVECGDQDDETVNVCSTAVVFASGVPGHPVVPAKGHIMRDQLGVRLEQVLFGLRFPAQRWQIITHADLYGVDAFTRHLLHRLPRGMYQNCADVVAAITVTSRRTDSDNVSGRRLSIG